MAENQGWDGQGYILRFSQPHIRGAILERETDGAMNFTEGKSYSEFNHLFSDIINGQLEEGLTIAGVWESPRRWRLRPLSESTPGSTEHQSSILPYGLSTVSRLGPNPKVIA